MSNWSAGGAPAAPMFYDWHTALLAYAPGVVITRDIELALSQQFEANGEQPLTQAQVLAIVQAVPPLQPIGQGSPALPVPPQGPLPPPWPTGTPAGGLPRFKNSNEQPLDDWTIEAALYDWDWSGGG
jgi:hypothetical protein